MAVNEQNITPDREAVKFALSHYPQFPWLALTVFVQTLVVPEPKQKCQLTLFACCHCYVAITSFLLASVKSRSLFLKWCLAFSFPWLTSSSKAKSSFPGESHCCAPAPRLTKILNWSRHVALSIEMLPPFSLGVSSLPGLFGGEKQVKKFRKKRSSLQTPSIPPSYREPNSWSDNNQINCRRLTQCKRNFEILPVLWSLSLCLQDGHSGKNWLK